MHLFPIDWQAGDIESASNDSTGSYEIQCYGKTANEQHVLVRIAFFPYFFVRSSSPQSHKVLLQESIQKFGALKNRSMCVDRVPFWGFCNATKQQYVQLAFPTHAMFKKAKYGVKHLCPGTRVLTYEANLDPLLRFFHVRNISPASWICVEEYETITNREERLSVCDLEIRASFTNILPLLEYGEIRAPLIIASWDIECVSKSGMFPDASKPDDAIITIGTAFQKYGDAEPYCRNVITLNTCDSIPGVDVVACAKEHDVLNEWFRLLRQHKTDVMVGYNTFGFDYKYIYNRSLVLIDVDGESLVDMSMLGHSGKGGGVFEQKQLSSSAYGENTYVMLSSPGILRIDLLQIFRKDLKLESYSLKNVCKEYLEEGETKIDLKASEIFQKYLMSSSDRAEIAKYCIRDVELPLKLLKRLSTLENLLQMANAVCVPIDQLQTRGQQIRVYSQLLRKCRELGFVVKDMERDYEVHSEQQKYVGATVLDARKGSYFEVVSALDFASLYPSIMRAHCMCPSTLVMDHQRYGSLDGVEYYEIEQHRFAQNTKNVVPLLLQELAEFRLQAKRDMADAKKRGDDFQVALCNAKQLAYKISMNSIYGFFGASKGLLPLIQLASSVTATGRKMIEHSKEMAEKLFPGTKVIYGDTDSIFCIFKLPDDSSRYDMYAHFEVAQKVAREITRTFKRPIELEFEKCYYPLLLFSKKRYAGLMYTSPDLPDKIDVKGIQLVRRDNAPIVRDVSSQVLAKLMHEKSVQGAIDSAVTCILKVLKNELPIENFVISKALRTGYKHPDALPHVVVAKKRQARGNPASVGERVPYVFVIDHAEGMKCLQAERAEDPLYVVEHALRIDTLFYLENQLLTPITTLLDILDEVNGTARSMLLEHAEIAKLLAMLRKEKENAKRLRTNAMNKQLEITRFLFRQD
jgi:DNA polymerase delta subunit 1